MTIYADVLIVLNTLVDYFLIKIAAKLANEQIPFWRIALASLLGGVLSLYIFLPSSGILSEISIRFSMSLIMTVTVFGFKNIKSFLRNTVYLFAVTYLYGGFMFCIWLLFKPSNLIINNSIVYINISPIILIISSAIYYFIVMLIRFFLGKNAVTSENCTVQIRLGERQDTLKAIVDTGNSLTDVFGMSEIIITSKNTADRLIREESESEKSKRYRTIPVKTISGTSLIDGYRIDEAKIITANDKKVLINPILAVSNTKLDNEWDAIINPRSLL